MERHAARVWGFVALLVMLGGATGARAGGEGRCAVETPDPRWRLPPLEPPRPRRAEPPSPPPVTRLHHLEAFLARGRALMDDGPGARPEATRWLGLAEAAWEALEDPIERMRGLGKVAEARFLLGEIGRAEFQEEAFDDMSRIDEQVDAKLSRLLEAQSRYERVVDMKVAPWSARAAWQIGRMHAAFVERLSTMPFPDTIPRRYHRGLREELMRFGAPFRERALTSLREALALAEADEDEALARPLREELRRLEAP